MVTIQAHQIKTVCAWCKKHLSGYADSVHVSHGCCADCSSEIMKTYRSKRERLSSGIKGLSRLSVVILFVIVSASSQAALPYKKHTVHFKHAKVLPMHFHAKKY